MPFDPLPTSLPDLSRSRPKSFRRGTAIDHIVSFPSPPPIGGASTERRDPASLFASSTSQRPASVSGHGGLRVWQAARSGSCLHYHTNGRSIQDLRSYLPTRDQLHAHTHTRARAFPWPRTRDRAPLRVYQRARSTTLFDALHAFNDRIPLSCTRPPFQPPSSSSCAMEPTVERMFRGSEWKKRRKARARCWKLARGGAKQSVIGRKGRDGWKHSIDLSLKARMIRRGILVRVTRSVLFRARFRITWERGRDASVVPGNRNLASSYVPRDFTDELLDRGTISISDFSERARAHSHFPYVSSSTVREYENSVVTTTTTTMVVVAGYRLETLPLPPIVISKISDCYSCSNGTLAEFVVCRGR